MTLDTMTPPFEIAHYRVTAKLGEGAMGAVYRATDTKLGRDVAIKILPAAFAEDSLRMQRFEREAQVLASLNHPNIAAIYGIEQRAIVMELVDGANLPAPVPLETAMDYARQIAAGLEAAHERGVVHRDLKPANIKVTTDGVVKLLDFGLAKTTESTPLPAGANPTDSPTISLGMTQAGIILGTAAYMAPEQARGKAVDKRADIWAFGAVLFEMLSGKSPFSGGETISDALASIIAREPDWTALPKNTPLHLHRLLARCLRKDPKLRLRDIGEARILLDEPPLPAAPAPASRSRVPWAVAAIAALVAVAAIGVAWKRSAAPEPPPMHIRMDLGPDAVAGARLTAALSPNGRHIAYVTRGADGRQLLTVAGFDQSAPVVLGGTDGADDPCFSPDGQWIGYRLGFRLMKMPIQGGEPVTIATAPSPIRGVAWAEDGDIVIGTSASGLYRVSTTGGKVQALTYPAKSKHSSDRWPQFLPGNQTILYSGSLGIWSVDDSEILSRNVNTGESRSVYRGGYNGRYIPGGYLLFLRQGGIFGVRFDPASLKISGQPVKLLDGVSGDVRFGGGDYSLSRTGTLAYHGGKSAGQGLPVVAIDSSGQSTPLTSRQDLYFEARLSPDGRFLAVVIGSGNGSDISVWDIGRQVMSPLTSGHNDLNPVWMPDSRHLIYATRATTALWWARADGSSEPRKLLDGPEFILPSSVSTDGRRLAYYKISPGAGNELWTLPIDASDPENPKTGPPEPFLRSGVSNDEPSFSVDGRWLAYRSDEARPGQIFVRAYPAGPGKWQISRDGGWWPRFSPNGKQLFYVASDGHLMAVDYSVKGSSFEAGTPRAWADTTFTSTLSLFAPYDLTPDGKRVLFVPHMSDSGDKGSVHVELVLNFFDEVRRRIP